MLEWSKPTLLHANGRKGHLIQGGWRITAPLKADIIRGHSKGEEGLGAFHLTARRSLFAGAPGEAKGEAEPAMFPRISGRVRD